MKVFLSAACLSVLFSIFAVSSVSARTTMRGEDLPEWTILVYLNADNNLHSAGIKDLKEMEKIGSSNKVNLVVQFDGSDRNDSARYFIKKDTAGSSGIVSPVIQKMGEVDMGDWHNLADFLVWGITNYPAKRYFVDVWNHGSGWLKTAPVLRGISYDDESGNHITTPQLGEALKAASDKIKRKIDIYGSDACLMQMLEVGYELKDYVNFVVGSEETEPGDGWPYDDFLGALNKLDDKNPRTVSELLVESYWKSYSGGSQGTENVTLSALDLGVIDEFMKKLDDFSGVLSSRLSTEGAKITDAVSKTLGFSSADNKDLFDFTMKLTQNFSGDDELNAQCDSVREGLKKMIIKAVYVGERYENSYGLAIWTPSDGSSFEYSKKDYSELSIAGNSSWFDFLSALNKSENLHDENSYYEDYAEEY